MTQQVLLSPITLPELVSEITREVTRAMRAEVAAMPTTQPAAPEELLSRDQAAQLLAITLPTLREYTHKGLVNGYRIGTRVRYKRSEVIASLQRIRTSRNK
jgi:excisionase family DNA binding protein